MYYHHFVKLEVKIEIPEKEFEQAVLDALNKTKRKSAELSLLLDENWRRVIDDWIKSGCIGDGRENPFKRSAFRARLYGSAPAINICKMLSDVVKACQPGLEVDEPEEAERLTLVPSCLVSSQEPCSLPPDFAALILLSDLSLRLGKCRRCGVYFLKRPRQHIYEHGLYCCREHQSATASVMGRAERRKRECRELIKWAASELRRRLRGANPAELNEEARYRMKQHITDAVNKRIGNTRNQIKVKWVTQHWSEITKEDSRAQTQTS